MKLFEFAHRFFDNASCLSTIKNKATHLKTSTNNSNIDFCRSLVCILFFSALLISGCQNNGIEKVDNQNVDIEAVAAATDSLTDINHSDNPYEVLVLGDIHFGVSKEEFAQKKSAFLKKHKKLNGLGIDYIKGIFYDGKLERILIRSEKHICLTHGPEHYDWNETQNPWMELYEKKYGVGRNNGDWSIEFVRKNISYRVGSNLIDRGYGVNSFLDEPSLLFGLRPAVSIHDKSPRKYGYTIIDIRNELLFQELKNQKERTQLENEQQREKEALDLI